MGGDRRKLIAAARRLLGTADAEDAVQDTYLRTLLAAPPALRSRRAWLHTVLRHVAIDRLRRKRLEQGYVGQLRLETVSRREDGARLELALEHQPECLIALRHLLRRVTPAEAAAIVLHAVFEFEHAEIARRAGKSEGTIRQCLHRALLRARRGHGLAKPADQEDHYVGLCWQAIERRDPAVLLEMIATPAMVQVLARPAAIALNLGAAPRASSVLVQVNGRYAMALVLDGIILCTVPLGPVPQVETVI